jgi:hypothetical protein
MRFRTIAALWSHRRLPKLYFAVWLKIVPRDDFCPLEPIPASQEGSPYL